MIQSAEADVQFLLWLWSFRDVLVKRKGLCFGWTGIGCRCVIVLCWICWQGCGADPALRLNDNADLPRFMLVVNMFFEVFSSLSIGETDESAEMRMNIP